MKKLVIICGLLFSAVTFASAQGGRNMGTPEERAAKMTTRLTEKLSLTAEQQTQVKAIFEEQATALSKARAEAGEDRKATRQQMMERMKENDEKINALLTDDQKKAYATYKEERKAAMQNRGNKRGDGQSGKN